MAQLRDRKGKKKSALRSGRPESALSSKLRQSIYEKNEDENSGGHALAAGVEASEAIVVKAEDGIKTARRAEQKENNISNQDPYTKENVKTEGQCRERRGGSGNNGSVQSSDNVGSSSGEANIPDGSNVQSRRRQKYNIKRSYSAAESGNLAEGGNTAAGSTVRESGSIFEKASEGAKQIGEEVGQFVAEHWNILLVIAVIGIMIILLAVLMTSCSAVSTGGGDVIFGTSYTAADDDILGAEEDYIALEEALNQKVTEVRAENPGYDEYRFDLDEIGHDPYQLAAILTILKEDYTREDVQDLLQKIFELQYEMELTESVETRYHSDRAPYEYKILSITLKNNTLDQVIEKLEIDADKVERYELIYELKGNRAYIFGGDIYTNPGSTVEKYKIPGEALTDERFANMMAEAEKYLGVPYVWGGYNPKGFDCSGFVSWVINHCGNGWNYGHLTTWGLEDITTPVSKSEAQPGDLIFFEGTYDTVGPSHVGIYVGNGMMLHCGNPVHYSSINTSFWQEHFRGFRRLP